MNIGITSIEWLNGNSLRAYPFMEDSGLRPTVGGAVVEGVRLPNCAVLDLSVSTSQYQDGYLPKFYMRRFSLVSGKASIVLADGDGDVASAMADISGSEYTEAEVSGVGDHDDIRGSVVFGRLSDIVDRFPEGVWEFGPDETPVEPRCVVPGQPCVSGLYIMGLDGSVSKKLRGDVAIVAGNNVHLEYDEEANAIIVNADANYGFNDDCACADLSSGVSTLNGLAGDVEIVAGDCVQIEKDNGRIRISNTCSKPCCGCSELTFLNDKTNAISTSITKLSSFMDSFEMKLNEFMSNLTISRSNSPEFS